MDPQNQTIQEGLKGIWYRYAFWLNWEQNMLTPSIEGTVRKQVGGEAMKLQGLAHPPLDHIQTRLD